MMSRPANELQVAMQTELLLRRSLPGARASVATHVRRAQRLAIVIYRRWQVGPHQWQCKHIRWALEHGISDLTPVSQYDYWLSVEKALVALGRRDDWLPRLRGPWLRPSGEDSRPRKSTGRPPRLPGRGIQR